MNHYNIKDIIDGIIGPDLVDYIENPSKYQVKPIIPKSIVMPNNVISNNEYKVIRRDIPEDSKYPSSDLLMSVPKEIMIINGYRQADMINAEFSDRLSAPAGIYSNYSINPIIDNSRLYYVNDVYTEPVLGEDIDFRGVIKNNVKIYDSNRCLVALDIRPNVKYSSKPILPYVGYYLLLAWLGHSLNTFFTKLDRKYQICLSQYFDKLVFTQYEDIEEFVEIILSEIDERISVDKIRTEEGIWTCSSDIWKNVDKFVSNDVYNIYGLGIKGTDIEIYKYADFRIYEWTLNYEEEHNNIKN